MHAIKQAHSDAQRSYLNAKASVGQQAAGLMASSPGGVPFGDGQKYANAQQQLAAFNSWVFAAIRPIANRIAAQPIRVGRPKTLRTSKGKPEVALLDEHPILTMFSDPNNIQTGYGLLWALVASLNLTGRAFLFVPEKTDPPQAFMIPVSWVKGHAGTTGYTSWYVQPPGHSEAITVPADRMVYFAFPDPSDPWGAISPLAAVASAINNDASILQSQRAAFSRGMHPSHAVIVGKNPDGRRRELSPVQQRQIISAIKTRYQGTAKHGEPFIVDGLIEDIRQISHSPGEMDWISSSKDVKSRILEAFGVSPYIIGASEPGSRAASIVAEMHFLKNTVNPLIQLMNASLTEWLRPMFAKEGERLEVYIEEAKVDDDELDLKIAQVLLQGGAIQPNELRFMFGFAPLPSLEEHISTPQAHASYGASNRLQEALGELVNEQVAELDGARILASVESGNGNGRY